VQPWAAASAGERSHLADLLRRFGGHRTRHTHPSISMSPDQVIAGNLHDWQFMTGKAPPCYRQSGTHRPQAI
jgi:hypothetical protein